MATKIDLDGLILRADFNETETDAGLSQAGSLKGAIEARDLQKGEFFFTALRKPDFQRETNEWDAGKIIDIIDSFIKGDVIPAVILWRATTGLIYVIDGSHRLSALAAWVNDDYGDGQISKTVNDDGISQEQIDSGNTVRIAVNQKIGSYADHKLALTHPNNVPLQTLAQSKILALQTLPMQIVRGTSVKAEQSFRKINEQGVALDGTEKKILDSRDKPRGISVRAIVKGGKGYNYWSGFDISTQTEIKNLAREIHELLYLPKLSNPIKTTDLPLAGKAGLKPLTLVWDFMGIVNPILEEEQDDGDGKPTVEFLNNCRKAVQRVLSVHKSSLGLHPLVYTYSPHGKFKPASLYAIIDLVLKLDAMPNGFVKFSKVRENLEKLLIENDYIITQLVRQSRGAFASYPSITQFYLDCIENFSSGLSIAETLANIFKSAAFSFLAKPVDLPSYSESKDFSTESKSFAYIKRAFPTIQQCPFCRGLLHCNGISTDHIEDKSVGGDNSPLNAQPSHPYCNSTLKRILAAESGQPQ